MSDIVKRLREVAEIETGLLYSRRQLLKDAADEITRLRSERDAAKAMCDEMANEATQRALEEAAAYHDDLASRHDDASDGGNINHHVYEARSNRRHAVAIRAIAAYRKAQEVGNG